jgi:hypothetical protein
MQGKKVVCRCESSPDRWPAADHACSTKGHHMCSTTFDKTRHTAPAIKQMKPV